MTASPLLHAAERCRSAARRLGALADEIEQEIGSFLRRTEVDPIWKGPAADQFVSALEATGRETRAAAVAAREHADRLRQEAQELEERATSRG